MNLILKKVANKINDWNMNSLQMKLIFLDSQTCWITYLSNKSVWWNMTCDSDRSVERPKG